MACENKSIASGNFPALNAVLPCCLNSSAVMIKFHGVLGTNLVVGYCSSYSRFGKSYSRFGKSFGRFGKSFGTVILYCSAAFLADCLVASLAQINPSRSNTASFSVEINSK